MSLSSVGNSDKTSIVEVIVEFCSDTGDLVDILVVGGVPFGKIRFWFSFVFVASWPLRQGTLLRMDFSSSSRRGSWAGRVSLRFGTLLGTWLAVAAVLCGVRVGVYSRAISP